MDLGLVLQGYFWSRELRQHATNASPAVSPRQPAPRGRPPVTRAGVVPQAARVLPHRMLGLTAPRTVSARLPGMGIVRPGLVATAQPRAGTISTPLPMAQIRLIGPGARGP
jgi:hypothetical protein